MSRSAEPAASSPAIETRALSKRYREIRAVNELTITVPRGVIAGLVGPNGSGKTTTIRTLVGLVRPTSGSAFMVGESCRHPQRYMRRVGALIEAPAFYPSLSGHANLAILARLGGHERSRIKGLLELVGLKDRGRDLVRTYSLGMKQRLGIAAALLADPELLILDEPANGLDPPGIIEMRALLRRLRDEGRTLFVSSHILAELEQIADWLVVLKDGQALYCGPADRLSGRDGAEILVATERPEHLAVVAAIAERHGHRAVIDASTVRVSAPAQFAGTLNQEAMAEGALIVELHRLQSSLEENFLRMIGEGP